MMHVIARKPLRHRVQPAENRPYLASCEFRSGNAAKRLRAPSPTPRNSRNTTSAYRPLRTVGWRWRKPETSVTGPPVGAVSRFCSAPSGWVCRRRPAPQGSTPGRHGSRGNRRRRGRGVSPRTWFCSGPEPGRRSVWPVDAKIAARWNWRIHAAWRVEDTVGASGPTFCRVEAEIDGRGDFGVEPLGEGHGKSPSGPTLTSMLLIRSRCRRSPNRTIAPASAGRCGDARHRKSPGSAGGLGAGGEGHQRGEMELERLFMVRGFPQSIT